MDNEQKKSSKYVTYIIYNQARTEPLEYVLYQNRASSERKGVFIQIII